MIPMCREMYLVTSQTYLDTSRDVPHHDNVIFRTIDSLVGRVIQGSKRASSPLADDLVPCLNTVV